MAQTMGTAARQLRRTPQVMYSPLPSNAGAAFANGEFEWADLTAAPALAVAGNGDFGNPCHWFRCLFTVKTLVLPTGTSPTSSRLYIECADNAALTTNNRKIGIGAGVLPAVAGEAPTLPGSGANYWPIEIRGALGDGARQFARPGVTLGTGGTTNATITFDAFLCAGYPGSAAGDLD